MSGTAAVTRQLTVLCLVVFLGLLLLLGLGETDRVTTAVGVVRPVGESLPVQAPFDGRITRWRVQAAATVQAGEFLGALDMSEEATRLAALAQRALGLEQDLARFEALLDRFADGACDRVGADCPAAPAGQREHQQLRESSLEVAERRAADARRRTLQEELQSLTGRLEAVALQRRWQQPECDAHRHLVRGGRVAEVQWWAAERRCAELEGLERGIEGEGAVIRARLAAHQAEEARRRATVLRDWGESLAAARREIEAVEAERALLRERHARAQIRATVGGRLDCTRPGFLAVWVRAGEVLCSVLPQGAPSEVQVALPEHARQGVHVGQPVSLRVRALPWMRHGLLRGRVATISADTRSSSEAGAPPVYQVAVRLDPGASLTGALEAGMQVEADLHRGRVPLWRWLLEPLADLHLRAGREP